MKIFETHCHLNSNPLDKDINNYLHNASLNGVDKLLVVGYDIKTSLKAIELANAYKQIYASVGIHPTEIDGVDINTLEETLSNMICDKVVAIGEIGLDYYWVKDIAKREKQKEYFIKQIEIANTLHLPIIVHSRDCINDTYQVLKEHPCLYGGVIHCFSGSVELMKEFIKLGYHISLGGPVTYKNAVTPKEVAKETPLNRLLVETDSPYLAPTPFRGSVNQPSNIIYIISEIARQKGISDNEVACQTYDNAIKLFHVKHDN